jgi:hypothetical protein
MLDLTRTRQRLLEEIGATPDARPTLVVRGATPAELLPVLDESLARCFADVTRERRAQELLVPLKKAVGNAYKWGNRRDASRRITVAAVVTPAGAVVSVSDEGEGFDAQAILEGLRGGRRYFTHGGSGFDHFERSRSKISYGDGGRTLLLRFLRDAGVELSEETRERLGTAADGEAMKRRFERELPPFRAGERRLEGCRAFLRETSAAAAPEIQYVLEQSDASSGEPSRWQLTGRLLPQPAARTEFQTLHALADPGSRPVGCAVFPRPVALLDDPSMVVLELGPSQDLRSRVRKLAHAEEWKPLLVALARGLRAVHDGRQAPGATETVGEAIEAQHAAWDAIRRTLRRAGGGRDARAGVVFQRLSQRAEALAPAAPTPIHGAFGWDCVASIEGQLYVYGFERSRRSHPGFDLGGFLADLFRFHALREDAGDLSRAGRETFLDAYAGGGRRAWFDELPFFEAAALIPRLERLLRRPQEKWGPKVDVLLDRCVDLLA